MSTGGSVVSTAMWRPSGDQKNATTVSVTRTRSVPVAASVRCSGPAAATPGADALIQATPEPAGSTSSIVWPGTWIVWLAPDRVFARTISRPSLPPGAADDVPRSPDRSMPGGANADSPGSGRPAGSTVPAASIRLSVPVCPLVWTSNRSLAAASQAQ